MSIKNISLYKHILPITLFLTASYCVSTQAAVTTKHIDRLRYETDADIYIKKDHPEHGEENHYVNPLTGKVIKLKAKDKTGKLVDVKSAKALQFSPNQKGVFITTDKSLHYYNEYTKSNDGTVTVNIGDDKKKVKLLSNAKLASTPTLSQDGKQGVTYNHYTNNKGNLKASFDHFSLESGKQNPLYVTSENKSKKIDCFSAGKAQASKNPIIHAAISNEGKILFIIKETNQIKLGSAQWEKSKDLDDNPKAGGKKNEAWLKDIVHIQCNEKNKKFQLWSLQKKPTLLNLLRFMSLLSPSYKKQTYLLNLTILLLPSHSI